MNTQLHRYIFYNSYPMVTGYRIFSPPKIFQSRNEILDAVTFVSFIYIQIEYSI